MSVSLPSTKILFTIEISFAILDQSRAILSFVFEGEAGHGRARYVVICIYPALTQMTDGTEKRKIPSKFAKHAARCNEFGCKAWKTILQ